MYVTTRWSCYTITNFFSARLILNTTYLTDSAANPSRDSRARSRRRRALSSAARRRPNARPSRHLWFWWRSYFCRAARKCWRFFCCCHHHHGRPCAACLAQLPHSGPPAARRPPLPLDTRPRARGRRPAAPGPRLPARGHAGRRTPPTDCCGCRRRGPLRCTTAARGAAPGVYCQCAGSDGSCSCSGDGGRWRLLLLLMQPLGAGHRGRPAARARLPRRPALACAAGGAGGCGRAACHVRRAATSRPALVGDDCGRRCQRKQQCRWNWRKSKQQCSRPQCGSFSGDRAIWLAARRPPGTRRCGSTTRAAEAAPGSF